MKKFFASAVLVAVAVLLPANAAHAYGEVDGPTNAAPGATYTYNITDLPTNDLVTLSITGPGGVTTTSKIPTGSGPYATSFDVTFPTAGTYTLSASQPGNPIETLSIAVAAVPSDSDGLAVTGFNAAPYLWFGGGLLALGAALVAVLAVVRRGKDTVPTA